MLKYFYKTLLISILSGSLMTMNWVAYADTSAKPEFPEIGVAGISETHDQYVDSVVDEKSKKNNSQEAAATNMANDTITTSIKGTDNSPSMVSSLTMVAIGLVASRLYTYKMTPDVMLAAAGGAMFIFGEISTTQKINAQDITVGKDGRVDNAQLKTLEELKAKLEKIKSGVEAKYKLQKNAGTAFLAAAAAAIAIKGIVLGLQSTCKTLTATLMTTCTASACPAPVLVCVAKPAAAETATRTKQNILAEMITPSYTQFTKDTSLKTLLGTEQAATGTIFTTGAAACLSAAASCLVGVAACEASAIASNLRCGAALSAQKIACAASSAAESLAQSYGQPVSIVYDSQSIFKNHYVQNFGIKKNEYKINPNLFEKLLNFALPSAHGGITEILFGAGKLGVGIVLSKALGQYVDTMIFSPMKRAVVWGVLAGLTMLAQKSSKDTLDEVSSNIEKVNKIINSLPKENISIIGKIGNGKEQSESISKNITLTESDLVTPNGEKIDCMLKSGNTNCPSVAKAIKSSEQWKELPLDIQNAGQLVGAFADTLQGTNGIKGSQLTSATNGLSANNSALQNAINKGKKDIGEKLKKMNLSDFDFKKAEDKMTKDLNKTTENVLRNSGASAASVLASMGSGIGPKDNGVGLNSKSSDQLKKSSVLAPLPKAVNIPEASPADHGSLDDSMKGEVSEAASVEEKNSTMDDYELKNDITQDKDTSIFELITNRYQKSYDRLFKRVKE